jgi:hypothetical protein
MAAEFSRDQKFRIWKATLAIERMGKETPDEFYPNAPTPVFFRNDSGAIIPPYSLMQISGCVELEASGQNFVTVRKPIYSTSKCRCPLLLNGAEEIEVDGFGTAQSGPVFRVKTDGTAYDPGDRLGPENASWQATYGAMYTVLGNDDIEEDIVRVMFDVSSMRGQTISPLVAGTPGNVKMYDANGTLTTKEYLAETQGTTIAATTDIILWPQYGRLFALKYC